MKHRCLPAISLALLAACSRTPAPAPDKTPAATKPVTAEAIAAPAPAHETVAATRDWELPGTLHPLATQLELEARFGKQNVREELLPGAEGIGSQPVLAVFPEDPRKRLELVLDPDNKDAPITALRVTAADSVWHAASGVHPGMTLAQLAALNTAPVSFYGLAWDYGGTVQNWNGGKLANAVGNPVFHGVVLGAKPGAPNKGLPLGDSIFRSDTPGLAHLGEQLVVTELSISWPHEGED